LALLLAVASEAPAGKKSRKAKQPVPAARVVVPETGLNKTERILHLLNRAAFGPRPGDVERVREEGVEAWIERQLHPEIVPDPAMGELLADLPTLAMRSEELLVAYPPPQLLRGISRRLASARGMDPDAVRDLFPELEQMRRRQEMRESMTEGGEDRGRGREDRMAMAMSSPNRIVLELSQAKLLRAVHSERQLQEVMTDFWFNHFNVYIGKGGGRWSTTAYERDAIRPHALGSFRDLLGATARHPAMLFYLDNWLSAAPGTEVNARTLEAGYARAMRAEGLEPYGVALEVLRDRGIDTGGMEEMIRRQQAALARNPRGVPARGREVRPSPNREGLNENYARELLELHTLGVDGGYTQQDIIEIARCFTGWTLMPPQHGQGFVYIDALHDRGAKKVLGTKIKSGGIKEGEAVLDLLSRHPSTARFISYKLAQRFVSDDPPASLVEAMAKTFRETDGDIRSVMRTLLSSDEFWSPDAAGVKMKTPFEFVASALRATDADVAGLGSGARPGAIFSLRELGQPLYAAQPPTGYETTADAWVSTGALLGRMKVGLGLAADRVPGVSVEIPRDLPTGSSTTEIVAAVGERLMGREPPEAVVAALADQIDGSLGGGRWPPPNRAVERLAVGWILASAEFQRR
jgi:uncharacterized protein (DUF1800 family)